jgi:hypothetical protein
LTKTIHIYAIGLAETIYVYTLIGLAETIYVYTLIGLAETIYVRCINGISGREITKYTVHIYGSGQPHSFVVILMKEAAVVE